MIKFCDLQIFKFMEKIKELEQKAGGLVVSGVSKKKKTEGLQRDTTNTQEEITTNTVAVHELILRYNNEIEKAKKLLDLREELKSIEIGLFIYQIENFKQKLNEATKDLDIYTSQNEDEQKKLNEIQATREVLKSNAAFADALMIHQKKFGEKKREWEMRIKRRENKNMEIPQEFYDTYRYYAFN